MVWREKQITCVYGSEARVDSLNQLAGVASFDDNYSDQQKLTTYCHFRGYKFCCCSVYYGLHLYQ